MCLHIRNTPANFCNTYWWSYSLLTNTNVSWRTFCSPSGRGVSLLTVMMSFSMPWISSTFFAMFLFPFPFFTLLGYMKSSSESSDTSGGKLRFFCRLLIAYSFLLGVFQKLKSITEGTISTLYTLHYKRVDLW